MKEITYTINYGGFIGCDEEYTIEVDDNATQDEIYSAIQDDFEMQIMDNCSWEIVEEEKDDEDDI